MTAPECSSPIQSIFRSVVKGRSSLRSSPSMRARTWLMAAIWVKPPRPSRAARRMKWLLGALPIPTVKSRAPPNRFAISSNRADSLETAPSVRNTTWRSMPSGAAPRSALTIAGFIIVPPSASVVAIQASAWRMSVELALTDCENSMSVLSEKRMTLNRSMGRSRASAALIAARACLID